MQKRSFDGSSRSKKFGLQVVICLNPLRSFLNMRFFVLLFASAFPAFAGVNPDGSYSEIIPVNIPAGRNGIQPNLSLAYNSNSGNGILGMGWSLQGISAIRRQNFGAGIKYDGNDTYAGPDGTLLDVSGNKVLYHALNENFTKYEPLGSDGQILTASNACGDGPCAWLATDRAGLKYYYGNTLDSRIPRKWVQHNYSEVDTYDPYFPICGQSDASKCGNPPPGCSAWHPFCDGIYMVTQNRCVVRAHETECPRTKVTYTDSPVPQIGPSVSAWTLTRVEDRNGNAYIIQYQQDNGQYYPIKITYTLGTNSKNYNIAFSYDTVRPDGELSFDQSSSVETNWRLNSIGVSADSTCLLIFTCSDQVWRYQFNYESNSSVSRIISILQFDASDNLNNQWSLGWNSPGQGFGTPFYYGQKNIALNSIGSNTQISKIIDINGDGLPDLVRWDYAGNVYWNLNTGNGFGGTQAQSGLTVALTMSDSTTQISDIVDINGDGLPDLLRWDYTGGVYWNLNTGSGFGSAGYANCGVVALTSTGEYTQVSRFVDINNDGLIDLVRWDYMGTVYSSLNTGSGFSAANPQGGLNIALSAAGAYTQISEILDVTGDGLPDLVRWDYTGGLYINRNLNGSFAPHTFYPTKTKALIGFGDYTQISRIIDINGDRLPDLVRWDYAGNAYWTLNTGTDYTQEKSQGGLNAALTFSDSGTQFSTFADMDGDSRLDLVRWDYTGGIYVNRFVGQGFEATYPSPGNTIALNSYDGTTQVSRIADINGDQIPDIIRWDNLGGVYGNFSNRQSTNLLRSIRDAKGLSTQLSYVSGINQPTSICASYRPCSSPDGYPLNSSFGIASRLPAYLVRNVSRYSDQDLDGNGQPDLQSTSYTYYNYRYVSGSFLDRASLGFEKIVSIDDASGNFTINTYRQDKPFQRLPVVYRNYLNGGALASEQYAAQPQQYFCDESGCAVDTANTPTPLQPRQFRYTGPSVINAYENGVLTSQKSDETLSQDTYGNVLTSVSTQSANSQQNRIYRYRTYVDPTQNTTRIIGLAHSDKACYSATECATGDSNFISETHFLFDGQPLGIIGQNKNLTQKDTYTLTADSTGQPTGVWASEYYTYDSVGNILTAQDTQGILTTFTYDSAYNQFPVSVSRQHGGKTSTTTAVFDARFGQKISETSADNGNTTITVLDGTGFATSVSVQNGSTLLSRSTAQYGYAPNWIQNCVNFGVGLVETKCTKKFADSLGRLFREEFPELVNGNLSQMAVQHGFNGFGQETQISEPFDAVSGAPTKWNTKSYDTSGRLVQTQTYDGKISTIAYQTTGLPGGAISCVLTTDVDGEQKQTCGNVYGKIAQVTEDFNGSNPAPVTYTYDSRGRLIWVNAPQGSTQIGYAGYSDKQAFIRDQNAGETDYIYNNVPGVGGFGQIATQKNGGNTVSLQYNAAFGRVSSVTKAGGEVLGSTTSYTYDETDVSFGFGRLTTLSHTTGGYTIQERYSYDARGENIQATRRLSHSSLTLCADPNAIPCLQTYGKTKDELGRVTDMLYPDGTHTQLAYVDSYSQYVSQVSHNGATVATYDNYTYDVAPHVGSITYGNGIQHQYTYDQITGQLNAVEVNASDSTALMDLQYTYNVSQNIQAIQDNVVTNLSATYTYDSLYRIQSATLQSGVVRSYNFDNQGQANSRGNLMTKDTRKLTYAGNTYPVGDSLYDSNQGQWVPNNTLSWSATGNLGQKGNFTYYYDVNNMMVEAIESDPQNPATIVGDAKFYYDHTGQRFLKTYLRGGVSINTWYLGDGIEYREKYVGFTQNSAGSFNAWQATKYIYGNDGKKISSITGNVQSTQPTATTANYFALSAGYSSSSVAGLGMKVYYTFYGIYAHENFGKSARMASLSIAAILLLLYLIYAQKGVSRFSVWMRLIATAMLISFITINCNWNAGSPPLPAGVTQGDVNTIISELYTGLPVGTVYYSHNHLRSGTLITDATGNEVLRITYTEYGEIDLQNSGKWNTATQTFDQTGTEAAIAIAATKYTGQSYDSETGFYYYNARYYDPQLGVFTTADTEVPNPLSAHSFNRHMYAGGNPVQMVDPTGHDEEDYGDSGDYGDGYYGANFPVGGDGGGYGGYGGSGGSYGPSNPADTGPYFGNPQQPTFGAPGDSSFGGYDGGGFTPPSSLPTPTNLSNAFFANGTGTIVNDTGNALLNQSPTSGGFQLPGQLEITMAVMNAGVAAWDWLGQSINGCYQNIVCANVNNTVLMFGGAALYAPAAAGEALSAASSFMYANATRIGSTIAGWFAGRSSSSASLKTLAEANLGDSGKTVLGSYPGYIEKAQRLGASYFDVGNSWDSLSPAQRWFANSHFLDVITARGEQVLMSIPKMNIRPGSQLEIEVRYLINQKGYNWINQWSLRPRLLP